MLQKKSLAQWRVPTAKNYLVQNVVGTEIEKPSVGQKALFPSFMEEGRHLNKMGNGGGAHGSWLGHKDDCNAEGLCTFFMTGLHRGGIVQLFPTKRLWMPLQTVLWPERAIGLTCLAFLISIRLAVKPEDRTSPLAGDQSG